MSRPKEAESIKLHALPNAAGFRQWQQHLRDEVVGAFGFPDQAFAWINRTETWSFEELADSQEFSTLDAKLAAAFSRIASGEIATRIVLEKERLALKGKLLKGRQIYKMLFNHIELLRPREQFSNSVIY